MPQLEKPVLSNTLAGTVLLLLPSNPLRSPIRSLSGLGAGTTNPSIISTKMLDGLNTPPVFDSLKPRIALNRRYVETNRRSRN
ncbi:hypothetical protein ABIC60_000307 [Phyllobacterium ifriqiyense]